MSEKKVIIASRMGEIQFHNEKVQTEMKTDKITPSEERNHITIATIIIIPIPIKSTFGGAISSSSSR